MRPSSIYRQLADFLERPEAQRMGAYFLMGELSESALPRAVGHHAHHQHGANPRAVSGLVRHRRARPVCQRLDRMEDRSRPDAGRRKKAVC